APPSRRSAPVRESSFLAATSSSLRVCFPDSARSRGVTVAYDHIPCRSGSPHEVRDAVHFFAATGVLAFGAAAVCDWAPSPAPRTRVADTPTIRAARILTEGRNRWRIRNLRFARLSLAEP